MFEYLVRELCPMRIKRRAERELEVSTNKAFQGL